MKTKKLLEHIRFSAELAAALEVSGWPKPGNVHRTIDHSDTRFEHFLAGSVALGSSVEASARKGLEVAKGRLDISRIGVGGLVRKAISDISESHKGGNTHLGICLMFVPLAASASKTYVENGEISLGDLRDNVSEVMWFSTPQDAVAVYKAIALVSSPYELGRFERGEAPDLYDKQAERKILEAGISLFDVMKVASPYDTVARELTNGMEISFKIGYKELVETFNRTGDINVATVHTFLRILSKVPDTFIARKVGLRKESDVKKAVEIGRRETMWVSEMAEHILNLGGLTTERGNASLWEFDRKLQGLGEDYSPGTTADLTATALMIALLCGLKF
ncbi:triphosphoribosyl-dephospho-CoA synthase [Candidatus Bathyarchaeota archaeon]|nr:triphosphoribosyl-dephospho-CoA synthase [Candidatus Bathyarchaeota archaeon]